ncbi:MAG: VCBS repeat-containing protein [Anaerolineae bacterium]|nr:VCBS repeat-containing protein [Anaerolineae bacterium]
MELRCYHSSSWDICCETYTINRRLIRQKHWPWILGTSIALALLFGALLVSPVFSAGPPIPLNTYPIWVSGNSSSTEAVAWGDVDGDGDLDMAVSGSYDEQNAFVTVHLNAGGILQATGMWTATFEGAANDLAWGDADNDGDLDLAVAVEPAFEYDNDLEDWVIIGGENQLYLNTNGTLSISPNWKSDEFSTTNCLAWGDVDNDGDLDLVVGNEPLEKFPQQGDGGISLYLNEGGILSPAVVWTSTQTELKIHDIAWGDMDNDGDLDLAVGSNYPDDDSGGGTWLYQNEDGQLSHWAVWSSDPDNERNIDTTSVAWGDVDNDGDLDLAAGKGGDVKAANRIYLNQAGVLETVASWQSSELYDTSVVAWGDLNGDGALDLVVGDDDAARAYVNSGGTLDSAAAWTSGNVLDARDLAPGDIDGDGDSDLAIANNGADMVYENTGSTLTPTAAWFSDDEYWIGAMAWGDEDNDGDLDLAVGAVPTHHPGAVRLYQNNSGKLTSTAFESGYHYVYSVAWGDMNGDGNLELATGTSDNNGVWVYLNDGTGLTSYLWTAHEQDTVYSVAWGDVDNDGDLDLATGYMSSTPTDTHGVRLYFNVGGTLQRQAGEVISFTGSVDKLKVAWGDVNGDGALDLAFASPAEGINVYLNKENTLSPVPVWQNNRLNVSDVAWGDVDSDNDLDLAVAYMGQPNHIYLNQNGALQTVAAWVSSDADRTRSLVWGDINNDGTLDLAAGNYGQPDKVYLNTGATLQSVGAWSSLERDNTTCIALGDVDEDGDLDFIAGDQKGELKLYPNNRDTQASLSPIPVLSIHQPGKTAKADFYASAEVLAQPTLPIFYTLNAQYAQSVARVKGYYSLNGGGAWWPAEPTDDTPLQNLTLSSTPVSITKPLLHSVYIYTDTATPIADDTVLTVSLPITFTGEVIDLDVHLTLTHTWDEDLVINLLSPTGKKICLVANAGGGGDNFLETVFDDDAVIPVWEGSAPFTGPYHPEDNLDVLQGVNITGVWRLVIKDIYQGDEGTLLSWGIAAKLDTGESVTGTEKLAQSTIYTYTWDVLNSNVFGQSDNVVFRLEAIPASSPITGQVAGPYMFGAYTARTSPFRLRGSQVRVMSGTTPVENAMVYHRSDPLAKATPYANLDGTPFRTNALGYLLGDDRIKIGDQLIALLPVDMTQTEVMLEEDFEGNFPPTGWTLFETGAPDDPGWQLSENAYNGAHSATHDDNDTDGNAIAWLVTPRFTVPANGQLTFWQRDMHQSWYYDHAVWITTGDVPNPQVSSYQELWSGDTENTWEQQFIDLSDYAGQQAYLAFRYEGDFNDEWYIDDVEVKATDAANKVALYYTSAAPTATGLNMDTVTALGVQTLTVSVNNPLLLFNLDISLEWDARQDQAFLNQLKFDLQRASELLFNATNGQAALGQLTLRHNKEHWNVADIQIHASNALIPNADVGGIVISKTTRMITANPFAIPAQTFPYTMTYLPGATRIGTDWSRYGEAEGVLGEDWPRALVHELGHYLFYLYDNYMGLTDDGALTPVATCGASLMGNPYESNEYRTVDSWAADCSTTLSARRNGGADWETITLFYPQLQTVTNPGPTALPLAVTQINEIQANTTSEPLTKFIFSLTDAYGAALQPGAHAEAFLYQGDRLVDLGHPKIDKVTAHGARAGDRLCVYEFEAQPPRWGCETLTDDDTYLALVPRDDWQPEILVTPWSSTTLEITVTNIPMGLNLVGKVYPSNGSATGDLTLIAVADSYTGAFTLTQPAYQAFIQVWVDESGTEIAPRREAVTHYAIGGSAVCPPSCSSCIRPPCTRQVAENTLCNSETTRATSGQNFRPAIAPDGQVLLYADFTATEGFYTLQKATRLPDPLPWATVVGAGYYVLQTPDAPPLTGTASINFRYRRQDVPSGEEDFLTLYHWTGNTWRQLPTSRHPGYNEVTAPAQGPGLYALMSSLEIPLPAVGWNLVSYPVQETRAVTDALKSIAGYYSLIYGYDATDTLDPWKVYAPSPTPEWVNDLYALHFGQGYWISATQAITWSLRGDATTLRQASAGYLTPPATYYGTVQPAGTFAPAAGMTVLAYVEGVQCGQGETLSVVDKAGTPVIVYTVNVGYTPAGGMCGTPGQTVRFQVGGMMMATTAVWDNNNVWELPLLPEVQPAQGPALSDIDDQITKISTPVAVTFTISDTDSALDSLWLYAESSNLNLVHGELSGTLMLGDDISFSGKGITRTITITPTTGITGKTTITITVNDGHLVDHTSFTLTVRECVYLPLICKDH